VIAIPTLSRLILAATLGYLSHRLLETKMAKTTVKDREAFRLIEMRLAPPKLERGTTVHDNILPRHGFGQSKKAYLVGDVLSSSR
jgi:hypothetical protein